ncbi:MAG: hypothetical protein QFX35_01290 [Candidatus Verstraetearchaeota archaeon]|nr:hypothetical protein [Candidatus Verstraetearchaeota archaeon]
MPARIVFASSIVLVLLSIASSQAVSTEVNIWLDTDTSLYSLGEPVHIVISGPPCQVSVSVTGPSGEEVFRDDALEIGTSGSVNVTLQTAGFALGSYNITVNGSAGICSRWFRLVEPFISVSCSAASPDGEPLSRPAEVYYYFNGTAITLFVNVSAPNNHLAASVDLGWLGVGATGFSPADGGTWASGTAADGSAWYVFLVNCTVPRELCSQGLFETRVEAATAAGASGTAVFLAALNFQPTELDSRLGGSTTDWKGITDFTNVTGLTFEFFNGSASVAKLTYTGVVNLCDQVTARSLLSLSRHIDAGRGRIWVNASALPALDSPAEVRMYGLSFPRQPGVLFDGEPVLRSGQTSGGPVRSLSWDSDNGRLILEVGRIGELVADGDPPYVAYMEPGDGNYTRSPTPSFRILLSDAASGVDPTTVALHVDGKQLSPAAASERGGSLWVNVTTPPLEEGWHHFLLTASDMLGNLGVATFAIAVDTTPPEVVSFLPEGGSYTGDPMQRLAVRFADALSGTSRAILFINSSRVAEVTGDLIEYTPATDLAEGPCNATVLVSDGVGNERTFSWSFIVDRTPPRIVYFHPEDAMIVPYNDSVYASFEDDLGTDLSRISLKIDGVEVAGFINLTDRTLLYFPAPPLSRGVHEATITVYDLAGNNATKSFRFRVDDIPPLVTDRSPKHGEVLTSRTVTISATLFDNIEVKPDLVKVVVDGVDRTFQSSVTKTKVTCQLPLDYGEHTVEIVLFDTSYNSNIVSWSFKVMEPQAVPHELVRDIIIMSALVVGIVIALVLVFVLGSRRGREKKY